MVFILTVFINLTIDEMNISSCSWKVSISKDWQSTGVGACITICSVINDKNACHQVSGNFYSHAENVICFEHCTANLSSSLMNLPDPFLCLQIE